VRRFAPDQPLDRGLTLIEASAGTGKTYTLTTLFLRLVAELGLRVQEILVVTFTEAATAELRGRIRARLAEAARAFSAGESDDPLLRDLIARADANGERPAASGRLQAALTDFDLSTISTIHGFCRRMLQENAFESGADFEAELLTDLGDLVREIVEDYWTVTIHDKPPVLVRALEDDVGLAGLMGLARRVAADPEMPVLPDAPPPAPLPDARAWDAAHARAAEAVAAHLDGVAGLLLDGSLDGRRYRASWLEGWLAQLDAYFSLPGVAGRWPPDPLRRLTPAALREGTKRGCATPESPLFDAFERLVTETDELHGALERWTLSVQAELAAYTVSELERRKSARHQQSFDDLLRLLDRALAGRGGEALADAVAKRFRAALIDEFQDTDPVQYRIFSRVFGGGRGRLFLIGDPKQAIYAFRGADIFAYLRAARDAGESSRFTLGTNYRSDARLLRAIEHLFGRAGVRRPFFFEELPFVSVGAHHAGDRLGVSAGAGRAALQIRFLERAQVRKDDKPVTKAWAEHRLPAYVAEDVVSFLASGARIEGVAVTPGDVAVLVRTNRQAAAVQAALREHGVPSVLHGDRCVLDTEEAEDLGRVLSALAEPGRADAVRSALATRLIGVTGDELAAFGANEDVWEGWLERFHGWHRAWLARGFAVSFAALLDDHVLKSGLLTWTDGERRLTNLLHLGELLHEAERADDLGPAGLVRWFGQQRAHGSVDAEARQVRLESDARAVQVVTVHKAKGLQYPVVWCPFLWDGRLPDARSLPLVFQDPADGHRRKLDLGSERLLENLRAAQEQAFAENLRLLYVALTRAEHRCTVYWGRFTDSHQSALGYLLHPAPGAADDPIAATTERLAKLSDSRLLGELLDVAAAAAGDVEVAPLVRQPGVRWRPAETELPELGARHRRRRLDRLWRWTSFSGMTRKAAHHGAGAAPEDHDALAPGEDAQLPAPVPDGPALLDGFPKGARAGTCLHALLEHLDFGVGGDELAEAAAAALGEHGFASPEAQATVVEALRQTLQAPIGPAGLRLADVGRADRLDELGFVFPTASGPEGPVAVTPTELAALLAREGEGTFLQTYASEVAELGFPPLRGFLNGAVDLVVRHRGRWYVMDYKSNYLGPRLADYGAERLRAAMVERHYVLQYLLYTVALHRYLRWRVPGYDYARDFGGVAYLFLRGMTPATDGRTGIFFDRPRPALIEGLSALLGPTGRRR